MAALRGDPGYLAGDIAADAEYHRMHFASTLRRPEQLDQVVRQLRVGFTSDGIVAARRIEDDLDAQTCSRADYDLLPALRQLRIPTLVIHGDRDFIPFDVALGIASAIPGSRLVALNDCGHFAYVEQLTVFSRQSPISWHRPDGPEGQCRARRHTCRSRARDALRALQSHRSYERPSATINAKIEMIPASSTQNPTLSRRSAELSPAPMRRPCQPWARPLRRGSTGYEAARREDHDRHRDGRNPEHPIQRAGIDATHPPARNAKKQARGPCQQRRPDHQPLRGADQSVHQLGPLGRGPTTDVWNEDDAREDRSAEPGSPSEQVEEKQDRAPPISSDPRAGASGRSWSQPARGSPVVVPARPNPPGRAGILGTSRTSQAARILLIDRYLRKSPMGSETPGYGPATGLRTTASD